MKTRLFLASALLCSVFISGCLKDVLEDGVTQEQECDLNGHHMTWSVGGSDLCADTFLEADLAGGEMTIHGIAAIVSSLSLDIEDLDVGTHEFNGSQNFVLLTQLGLPWISSDTLPGTYEITLHDETHNIIAGTFEVDLLNELNNEVKTMTGGFDVNYTD